MTTVKSGALFEIDPNLFGLRGNPCEVVRTEGVFLVMLAADMVQVSEDPCRKAAPLLHRSMCLPALYTSSCARRQQWNSGTEQSPKVLPLRAMAEIHYIIRSASLSVKNKMIGGLRE